MRNAETVLGIIQARGKQALPLEDIYRQLFNPQLYLVAYANLYSNKGAMTPGVNGETVDGMSLAKIDSIISRLRKETYHFLPVRRVYIPKKNGKKRPLGIPSWSDKLLGEVIRLILEAYYEVQFSPASHGFRPQLGCHTALGEIKHNWTGTKWFVEGDIASFYDMVDHQVLMGILKEKLHDNRFTRLIEEMLKAGYMENWTFHPSLSGTPQGSGVSPILANLYLDKLDKFVEQELLPKYNCGKSRRANLAYEAVRQRMVIRRRKGNLAEAKKLKVELQKMPSGDPFDPNYRRLRYVRYADDILLGYIGSKTEAEEIKAQIGKFLRDTLKLELSEEKTLITHASDSAARFLGYEIVVQKANTRHGKNGHRTTNGKIGLRIPADVVEKYCAKYMREGKPAHRNQLLHEDDFNIVAQYGAEYRGIVQYYKMAQNIGWLWKLHWVMKTSLLRTLAGKHKSTLMAMAKQHVTTIKTEHGTIKCVEKRVEREGKPPLIARFGGIHLRPQREAKIEDQSLYVFVNSSRSGLVKRLLAEECELCGTKEQLEMHHIRKLADLKKPGRKAVPEWVETMIARRRKSLALCRSCHMAVHAGKAQVERSKANA